MVRQRKSHRRRNPYFCEDQTAWAQAYAAEMRAEREEIEKSRSTADKIFKQLTIYTIALPIIGMGLFIAWKIIYVS